MTGPHRRTATPFLLRNAKLFCPLLLAHVAAGQFTSQPRWGQAVAVVNNQLFVHGGKTDEFGSFSYTAAPTSNDLLFLDLSKGFDPSSPPWQYLSGSANTSSMPGPYLAWHTLSAFNTTQLLLFGGDGGPNSPIVRTSQADSAGLLDVSALDNPTWLSEPQGWAGEPIRRIHHSTASSGGQIYLIGGEKDDGSGIGFSEHYMFNPNKQTFTQLPSENGPPDLYGEASVVLSDGRLLVFGGYSPSLGQLVPLTTIWSLDTTQSSLSWSTVQVSGNPVPPPRRAFASTWLEGDKVLIHGGSDADLQTSFNDGWILDTTVNPMTWTNVTELTNLGPRRDHFAVQVGSQVLFGFGYANNAGVPVGLSVFNVSQSAFAPSFTPQSTPSHTTLPVPTGTSGSSPGHSNGPGPGSGGATGAQPTGGSSPTGTNGGDPDSPPSGGDNKSSATAIALGTVFGFLTLAAGTVIVFVVYIRRRKNSSEQFHLINEDDLESPSMLSPPSSSPYGGILPWMHRGRGKGEKARLADRDEGWTFLGLSRRNANAPNQRRDMFANEDSSDFANIAPVRRMGSGSSKSWYSIHGGHERFASGGSVRPSLVQVVSGSLSSLRSIGAMFNSTMGIRRVATDGGAGGHAREKTDISLPLDPFGDNADNEGLLPRVDGHYGFDPYAAYDNTGTAGLHPAARPRGGRLEGSEISKYSDPFKDQEQENVLFDASSSAIDQDRARSANRTPEGASANYASSTPSTQSRTSLTSQLPPLITVPSHTSSDVAPSSSSLFSSNNGGPSSSISSQEAAAALSRSTSGRPRTTSIIGASGAPTAPVKRSNSWWGRFKRASLRDSNYEHAKSPTSTTTEFDFRDPNPPPGRLGAIQEASASSGGSPDTPESVRARRAKSGIYSTTGGHERSTTSLKTSRTADSEAIERMAGRVDVAQREATGTSIDYSPSTAGDGARSPERAGTWSTVGDLPSRRPSDSDPDPDGSQDIVDIHAIIFDEPQEIVLSPSDMDVPSPLLPPPQGDSASETSSGTRTPTSPIPLSAVAKGKRTATGGAVAARIAEYERRATLSPTSPVLPESPQKSRDIGADGQPKARRKSVVKYGLVQRPELFVANPDHSSKGSSDS